MKFLLGLLTVALLTVSCGTVKPLRNLEANPIPGGLKLTQIKKAIKIAGAEKGWILKTSKGANELEGYLSVRQHEVTVTIPYTTTNYQINYMSSTNMKYNSSKKIIHRSYGKWVNNLRQEINKEFRKALARE